MKIGTVSNVNAFKGTQEVSATTSPNEKKDIKEVIKDNKGKIAIGLGALAAIGIATVAIATRKKIPSELSLDEFRKIGKFDKGAATVKGKPFSGVINVANEEGKYALEYADGALKSSTLSKEVDELDLGFAPVLKKVYDKKDGVTAVEVNFNPASITLDKEGIINPEWHSLYEAKISDNKIVREWEGINGKIKQDIVEKQQDGTWKKTFQSVSSPDENFKNKNYSKHHILTENEAGNVISKKPVYTRKLASTSNETILKQTRKYIDLVSGNEVVETLKNGKPYARQITRVADDGSKRIVVEYLDKGSEGYYIKIIDIAKDGTREESKIRHRFISL